MGSPTAAAIYARISLDRDDTALGVTRQVADCLELAERRGWTVAETFIDNDCSATSGKPRPAYLRMMAALDAGTLDGILAWDLDRLSRSPRELEDIVDLAERRGVALASVGGEVDLATPQGRLTMRVKAAAGRHETEQLARRVRRKMAERAEQGAPHGRVPYGWRREYTHDEQGRPAGSRDVLFPEQAAIVREAAAAVLAGESLRALTAELNRRGAPTATGRPWTTTALRGMLLRPGNAAMRVHQGQVIGPGTWEPLFDADTHRRLVAVLTDPARRTSPASSAVKYLLSGLARCGVCGGPMRVLLAGRDGRRQDAYVCQSAFCVRRQRQAVDDFVSTLIIERLSRPDAADVLTAHDDSAAQAAREALEALRARLDLAADAYSAGDIDGPQLKRITAKLRPEIQRLETILRTATTAPDLGDLVGATDIAQRWDSLPLARRRAVIDLLMTVRVLRSTARGGRAAIFDPSTVEITWKTGP